MFYYNDVEGVSLLEAEIKASKKARKFNLKVLRLSEILIKERPRVL
jgi:hypothetical protein